MLTIVILGGCMINRYMLYEYRYDGIDTNLNMHNQDVEGLPLFSDKNITWGRNS